MIEPQHPRLSVVRQCELVSISRSGFYYQPAGETPLNLALLRLIDIQFLETPRYGSRQMTRHLRREGYMVGRKRVRRLMARMGLAPIYQRPRTTIPHPGHRLYPYLLRDLVSTARTKCGAPISVCRSKRRERWGRAPRNRLAGAGCKPP
jgi:putative transposase